MPPQYIGTLAEAGAGCIIPDTALRGITIEQLEESRRKAIEQYETVMKNHPGTPWALRAEREKGRGFGVDFREHFHDPRYDEVNLRVPKL